MPNPMADSQSPRVWWELAVHTDPAWADPVGEVLRAIIPAGLVQTGDGFTAYLPDEATARETAAAAADAGAAACHVRPIAESEWSNWRLAFRPVSIGRRLRIYPIWDAPSTAVEDDGRNRSAQGTEVPVVIEPGLAFGTGDHPTTAACLRYLEHTVTGGATVLDAGTGSGILAIAAALLGAARVVAVDIDPVACRSAAANVELNPGARGRVSVRCQDIAELEGSAFDVVVANLTSDVIISLLPMLLACLAAEGCLIVSGISVERAGEVMLALEAAGLVVIDQATERGWLTGLLRRGNGS